MSSTVHVLLYFIVFMPYIFIYTCVCILVYCILRKRCFTADITAAAAGVCVNMDCLWIYAMDSARDFLAR